MLKEEKKEQRRVTNMLERRSEGSRRSRRPRCHRNPGYLWAHLVSPVGGLCQASPPPQAAVLSPEVQRCPVLLAFQWKHLIIQATQKETLEAYLELHPIQEELVARSVAVKDHDPWT